jgi:hypothetical protein
MRALHEFRYDLQYYLGTNIVDVERSKNFITVYHRENWIFKYNGDLEVNVKFLPETVKILSAKEIRSIFASNNCEIKTIYLNY